TAPSDARARGLAGSRTAAEASRLRAARRAAERRRLARRVAAAEARRRYWLRLMHRPLPPPPRVARLAPPDLERAAEWRRRRAAALARHPPHLSGWHCIQRHETGAPYPGWRTNSGNGYYGGLQLDRAFQLAYGR